VSLGAYSREMLQALRRAIGIEYDQRTQGILHFYASQKEFDGGEGPERRCANSAAIAA
jgi:D-amino-acid dehydrogenase